MVVVVVVVVVVVLLLSFGSTLVRETVITSERVRCQDIPGAWFCCVSTGAAGCCTEKNTGLPVDRGCGSCTGWSGLVLRKEVVKERGSGGSKGTKVRARRRASGIAPRERGSRNEVRVAASGGRKERERGSRGFEGVDVVGVDGVSWEASETAESLRPVSVWGLGARRSARAWPSAVEASEVRRGGVRRKRQRDGHGGSRSECVRRDSSGENGFVEGAAWCILRGGLPQVDANSAMVRDREYD